VAERKSFPFFFFFFFVQAREEAKSGLVLFREAMDMFNVEHLEKSFKRFERAAAKGHAESIWILSVLEGVENEDVEALREAFAKTDDPLGWWVAGNLSDEWEAFDFLKKSAEAGCSWGQVEYGMYFKFRGPFVDKDEAVYLELLEKSAKQNNPYAMNQFALWYRQGGGNDKEKAVAYHRVAAELGWGNSICILAEMLRHGEGCEKDLRQAVFWGAKAGGGSGFFYKLLADGRLSLESGTTEDLDCDFNQFCYSLGWGLYWYQYENQRWNNQSGEDQAFGNRCLDFYCSCVELQQKSIFTFLLCWNRTTGVKEPGQMIAQMVWEVREDNLVKRFEQTNEGEEPEMKRIKK
jgi:hypothetical protein